MAGGELPWEGGRQLALDIGGWATVAPGALPFHDADRLPTALDQRGIEDVIGAFVDATRRAIAAEFQVIEIHAAKALGLTPQWPVQYVRAET